MTFFERGGAEVMKVFWGNPAAGIAMRTPIPDAAFSGTGIISTAPPVTTSDVTTAPVLATNTTTSNITSTTAAPIEAISLGSTVNMLIINGTPRALGRYPNTRLMTVHSHSGSNNIRSNDLPSSPNWTGAEVVIRKNRFVLDRQRITSHNGNELNFSESGAEPENSFGFFIQNHPQTLDAFGEWYFDPNSKKVRVFFGSENPNSYDVKATAADVLLTSFSSSYISFDNITFMGANRLGLDIRYAQQVSFTECELHYVGEDGVAVENMVNFTMERSRVENIANIGFRELGTNHTVVRNSIFNNIGAIAGMGKHRGAYTGFETYGSNILIEFNTLTNIGYNGITFMGNNITIKNNFIDRFGFVKDDGGGVYSYRAPSGAYGRRVTGNVILRGLANGEGTNSPGWRPMYGVFMDDDANNVEVTNNTVQDCGAGIFIHNAANILLEGNMFYDNVKQVYITTDQVAAGAATRNVTSRHNMFISKYADQHTGNYETSFNDLPLFGTFDNNIYARPIDDDKTIFVSYVNGSRVYSHLDLQGWKNLFGKDGSSQKSRVRLPAGSNPDQHMRFEYNASASSRHISLGETFLDVRGNSYTEITLQPYTSIVLIKANNAIRAATQATNVSTNSLESLNSAPAAGMTIFPNPASAQVDVSFTVPDNSVQKVDLVIRSASGATMSTMSVSANGGAANRIKVDVSRFAPGTYLVNILNKGRVLHVKKFIKL
jgi:parallel beta-helix repeat protein